MTKSNQKIKGYHLESKLHDTPADFFLLCIQMQMKNQRKLRLLSTLAG